MSLNLYKYHTNPETVTGFDQIMNTVPDMAWEHFKDNHEELRKREHLWAESARYSHGYAFYVLDGRFEKGEDVIATSATSSYYYANDVLRGERVEKIEDAIATCAMSSYYYVKDVLKGERFEKGEDAIATSARYSVLYAKGILNGKRFEKGEDAIATDAEYSYYYARDVFRGKRFVKGEDAIRGSEYQERYEELTGVRL